MEVNAEIDRGELSIEQSSNTSQEVTVLVGVTGEVRGLAMYGMSESTAKKIVSAIVKHPVPIFDEMAQSATAELGNVITGRASTNLSAVGFDCVLTPPTLITGRQVIISTLTIRRLVVPLHTNFGDIEINLALREEKNE
jgi:chemotaxis protein CheX